jgi:hypothetical protein
MFNQNPNKPTKYPVETYEEDYINLPKELKGYFQLWRKQAQM